jgi:hypothetical protein
MDSAFVRANASLDSLEEKQPDGSLWNCNSLLEDFQAAILSGSRPDWYCPGLRLPSAECLLFRLYQPSMYSKIASPACCLVK